jgi:hypothetical protein
MGIDPTGMWSDKEIRAAQEKYDKSWAGQHKGASGVLVVLFCVFIGAPLLFILAVLLAAPFAG